jgi:hypothetical protein
MDDPIALAAVGELADAALEDAITTLAANIAAANAEFLSLIGEFDRREAWAAWGVHSTAHWLNWKCGIALGAAREKVRVAKALLGLPEVAQAFSRGALSYSKVRAMTRVATRENESYLLMIAHHGTATHVEQAVRAYRSVDRLEANANAQKCHASRELNWYYDDDGMLVVKARLLAENGAMLLKALEAAATDAEQNAVAPACSHPSADVLAGTSQESACPAASKRADALSHLAEQFLARGASSSNTADHHQIVIHVDHAALKSMGDYSRSEIEHGPAVAPATARRLACDAAIIEIEENENGEALNIGRKTRSVPPAIRRALRNRDDGCRFPGCTNHRYVDAHHIRHWADGGETSVSNLVLLCRKHHRLVHEGGFSMQQHAQRGLLFRTPAGIAIPRLPAAKPAAIPISQIMVAKGLSVSAGTCLSKWGGERMDVGMAVAGLMACDGRMEVGGTGRATGLTDVPAGTSVLANG